MKKYNIKEKGYINVIFQETLNNDGNYRVYSINGIDCINLKGEFTANGVQNWFYEIANFNIENNNLLVPRFLPSPTFKLYNDEINTKNWGYSITEKENKYMEGAK